MGVNAFKQDYPLSWRLFHGYYNLLILASSKVAKFLLVYIVKKGIIFKYKKTGSFAE